LAARPESWEDAGGPGFITWTAGCLLVENRLEEVIEVQSLLRFLEAHRADLPRLSEIKRRSTQNSEDFTLLDEEDLIVSWRQAYLKYVNEAPPAKTELELQRGIPMGGFF
jgi:hypothetical protein